MTLSRHPRHIFLAFNRCSAVRLKSDVLFASALIATLLILGGCSSGGNAERVNDCPLNLNQSKHFSVGGHKIVHEKLTPKLLGVVSRLSKCGVIHPRYNVFAELVYVRAIVDNKKRLYLQFRIRQLSDINFMFFVDANQEREATVRYAGRVAL